MHNPKTLVQLKREYYGQPWLYFTPKMIDAVVAKYGDKPATMGEARYVLGDRLRFLVSVLPIIGRYFPYEGGR